MSWWCSMCRWRRGGRVCARNDGAGATFSFVVTREMFEMMELRWELPGVEELVMFGVG